MFKAFFKFILLLLVLISIFGFTRLHLFNKSKEAENVDFSKYWDNGGISSEFESQAFTDLNEIFSQNQIYWSNWDLTKNLTEFLVIDVDKESKLITLLTVNPVGKDISDKYIYVNPVCSSKQTVLLSNVNPTLNILDKEFDIFERIKKGQTLFTYCLEDTCLNIGKACVLIN